MGTTKEYELFKAAKFVLNVRNNLKISVKYTDSGTQRYAYFWNYQVLDEENIIEKSSEELNWFAMRATFGRELKAKKLLEGMQIECFIPMRYELVTY